MFRSEHDSSTGQLLVSALRGEEQARGALLQTYRSYLELLARLEIGRRLQTKIDTSDVVQETFLEAHRNFSNFRGTEEATFVAWLRGILAAKISNLLRHYLGTQGRDIRRERELEINLDQSSQMLDRGLFAQDSTPSRQVSRREQGVLLSQALAQLPDDYREVMIQRHLEERSFPEIAQHMNRSVDSVQKLWVRGLARLRDCLRDSEKEFE
jgi:RNA polymerase sigma-70 factor (ECF subfamily)